MCVRYWCKLPEVQQKAREQKKASEAATNRLRMKLYQQVSSTCNECLLIGEKNRSRLGNIDKSASKTYCDFQEVLGRLRQKRQ